MVKRRKGRHLVALGVLVMTGAACGSGFLDNLTGGVRDAGSEGDAEAGSDGRCQLAHVPPRPEVPDSPGPVMLLALSAMRADNLKGDASISPALGLDLDQACTCPEVDTCVVPDAGKHCDGDAGRDNALGPLFSSLAVFTPDLDGDVGTGRIRMGDFNLLFSISDWNGQPNDPSVKVAIFFSRGLEDKDEDGGRGRPKFDGSDTWTVDPASVNDGELHVGAVCNEQPRDCLPRYVDLTAYVRDGQLVAELSNAPIAISTADGVMTIEMVGVRLVGRLEPDGTLDGELSGRWPANKMLSALGRLVFRGSNGPLCKNDGGYEIAKSVICEAVDLAAAPEDDGKNKPCGAVSGAIHFTASRARAGTITKRVTPPNECESHQDSCE